MTYYRKFPDTFSVLPLKEQVLLRDMLGPELSLDVDRKMSQLMPPHDDIGLFHQMDVIICKYWAPPFRFMWLRDIDCYGGLPGRLFNLFNGYTLQEFKENFAKWSRTKQTCALAIIAYRLLKVAYMITTENFRTLHSMSMESLDMRQRLVSLMLEYFEGFEKYQAFWKIVQWRNHPDKPSKIHTHFPCTIYWTRRPAHNHRYLLAIVQKEDIKDVGFGRPFAILPYPDTQPHGYGVSGGVYYKSFTDTSLTKLLRETWESAPEQSEEVPAMEFLSWT